MRDPFDTGKRTGIMRVHEDRPRRRAPKRTVEQEKADLRTYEAYKDALLAGTETRPMPMTVLKDYGNLVKKYMYDPDFFNAAWSRAR